MIKFLKCTVKVCILLLIGFLTYSCMDTLMEEKELSRQAIIENHGVEALAKVHKRFKVKVDGYTLSCPFLPNGVAGGHSVDCYIIDLPNNAKVDDE